MAKHSEEIGAVLDKRFGDGSQEAVDEAIQAAFSGSPTQEETR